MLSTIMDTLSKYIQACSMKPIVRMSRPKQVVLPPQRSMPSFAVHASYGVSQLQSRVSHVNYNPYLSNSNQRISVVSSQKRSEATRAQGIPNSFSQISFTPRARLSSALDIRGLLTPPATQRNLANLQSPPTVRNNIHSRQRIVPQLTQPSPGRQSYVQNIPPINQHYPAPDMNPQRLSTFTTAYLDQSLHNSIVVHHKQPLLSAKTEMFQVTGRTLVKQKSVQSLSKSTIVQAGPPLVGTVTVQNIQMAPIIRNPPKPTRNRLYKSAVDGQTAGSVSRVLKSSRAYSTAGSNNKHKLKKADVLIRCNHRSIISDKKIPVLGSYYSKQKSTSFVIRQLSNHHGSQVIGSSIVGMELQQIIPTQVIKIPIGKIGDIRESRVDSCNAFENINQSSISEYSILDQPGLIKKYSPEFSRRNHLMNDEDCRSVSGLGRSSYAQSNISSRSRLTDSIKISVYKSPDVVIKKATTITSGPKLTKQHVKRVLVQGKDVSPAKYPRILSRQSKNSSQKSSSPIAKYESKQDQHELLETPSNPYIRKDVSDIIQKLKKRSQLFQRESNHLNQQQCSTKSIKIVSRTEDLQEEYPIRMAQCHRVQSTQHVSQVFPVTIPVPQDTIITHLTTIYQGSNNSYWKQTDQTEQYVERRFYVERQTLKNKESRQDTTVHSEDSSYMSSNIQSRHLSTHAHQHVYSWQALGSPEVKKQTPAITLESLNRHIYDIPKLADDLEEDLRQLGQKGSRLTVRETGKDGLFQ